MAGVPQPRAPANEQSGAGQSARSGPPPVDPWLSLAGRGSITDEDLRDLFGDGSDEDDHADLIRYFSLVGLSANRAFMNTVRNRIRRVPLSEIKFQNMGKLR
jgi:hypothetical protein